jgi:hypothetical protein
MIVVSEVARCWSASTVVVEPTLILEAFDDRDIAFGTWQSRTIMRYLRPSVVGRVTSLSGVFGEDCRPLRG